MLDELKGIEIIWEIMSKGYNGTVDSILGVKEKGQRPWIGKESWKVVKKGNK